jgi:DinB family protein
MALEDVNAAVTGATVQQLWQRPGGAASLGFHLVHLAGSTDRLLTYARGESLSPAQVSALGAERELMEPYPALNVLLARWGEVVQNALRQIAATPVASLLEHRAVGRAALPSTVLGLIFHAAEHAQRHVGQIVTTAKIIRGAEQ